MKLFKVVIFFLPFSLLAANQQILEINTFLDENRENISLKFLDDYRAEPSITYGPGWARVVFPKTGFADDLKFVRINDGFVRNVRFFPSETGSSLMEIEFADGERIFSKYIQIKNINGNINLAINTHKTLNKDLPLFVEPTSDSSADIKDTAQNSTLNIPPKSLNRKSDWLTGSLQMLAILIALLSVLYLFLRFLRKYQTSNIAFTNFKHKMKVLSSFYLSSKNKVIVLEIGQKKYALGVNNHNISLIAEVPGNQIEHFVKVAKENANLTPGELRQKYRLTQKNSENLPEQTKKSFSQELQSRLKNLKSIR